MHFSPNILDSFLVWVEYMVILNDVTYSNIVYKPGLSVDNKIHCLCQNLGANIHSLCNMIILYIRDN
jgi:hypothetical protein